MLLHYLTITVRNLIKDRTYSLINILGLSVGMASCIFILLYVQNELSYDRYHDHADRIYRVGSEWRLENGDINFYAVSGPALGPTLTSDIPAVEHAVRIFPDDLLISYGDHRFEEKDVVFADATVFKVFSFSLLKGDPETALADPYAIVLTEAMARKYFGNQDPMGMTLTVQDSLDCTVTGILTPVPANSHFSFDFIISTGTRKVLKETLEEPTNLSSWGNLQAYTYILLSESASQQAASSQIYEITRRYVADAEDQFGIHLKHFLQPLQDIYLHSDLLYEIDQTSNIRYIYIFLCIALFILVIACINFINLVTARSVNRAIEIGVRKVVGAQRRQLIGQFLGESLFMTLLASILTLVLIRLCLDPFTQMVGKDLNLSMDGTMLGNFILLMLFVGLAAGSYPAFLLSRAKPVGILKGTNEPDSHGFRTRKGLVIFQFALSIIMIISTTMITGQLDYMRNKHLGFEKEQIVVLNFRSEQAHQHYKTIKTAFEEQADVLYTSVSLSVPGRIFSDAKMKIENLAGELITRSTLFLYADHDFISTFGLSMAAGRNFSSDIATDETEAFLVNETAVRHFGWETPEDAIGRPIDWGEKKGGVIGVVKDFHHNSLQKEIEPMIIHIMPNFRYLSLKIRSDDIAATIAALEQVWDRTVPGRPFEYFFLDEDYDRQYRSEERIGTIFGIFSSLAIFIACLGMLGLVSFTVEQRRKEVGIRKVLGASIANIVRHLSKEFMSQLLWANVIAWPIAYYLTYQWLQDFAYRTDISIYPFLLSSLLAIALALFTVSYQSIKAAVANPVKSLRYE